MKNGFNYVLNDVFGQEQVKIETVCDIMTDASRGLPIQRYADVNALILKTQSKTCLDFYYVKLLQEMNQTGWNTTVAKRGGQ